MMAGRQRKSPGTITLNRKWMLRVCGLLLLGVAGALFGGPLMGIGNVVYMKPIAWSAGLGVAMLVTAEFTDD